jgi:Rnl2 family RNA ligase
MNEFIKWCSIENSYQEKYISEMIEYYPQLPDERYAITEKIDGSNFQWAFFPDGTVRAGSRNNYLDMNGSFQGANIQCLYETHAEFLGNLLEWATEDCIEIRLYGELHGQGIQKRIDYGSEKKLIYFGMSIDGDWLSFCAFDTVLEEYGAVNLRVPLLFIADNLDDALLVDLEFDTMLSDKEDNLAEGVVILPYDSVYIDAYGSPFVLKKKHPKFGEKIKVEKVFDTEVSRLNAEFKSYLTDGRLLSVFSKEGQIESPKQIGKYIKLLLEDAQVDFLKDNDISHLDKAQQKNVLNVGSTAANMLKGYL